MATPGHSWWNVTRQLTSIQVKFLATIGQLLRELALCVATSQDSRVDQLL